MRMRLEAIDQLNLSVFSAQKAPHWLLHTVIGNMIFRNCTSKDTCNRDTVYTKSFPIDFMPCRMDSSYL